MRIGQETVRSEFGFGLMNRISTGLASVAINALTGKQSGIPVVSRLLTPARAPLQAVASLIRVMSRDSKLSQALSSAVLAIAGAIVALGIADRDVPPGSFVVSAVLLTFVLVTAMARSGVIWLGIVSGLAAATIALAVVGADLQDVLTDKEMPVREESLAEGTTLAFDEGGRLRITTEPGDRIQDLDVPDNSSVVLQDLDAKATSKETDNGPQDWKRWGFTNHMSVSRIILSAIALAGAVALITEWRRSTTGVRVSRTAWIGLAVAAACAVRTIGANLLTDEHPPRDDLEDAKRWLIDLATDLNGFRLELVLMILVAAGIALSLGADLASSRAARAARRRIIEVFRTGGRELRDLVGPPEPTP
jgi:hypothetical protein